MAVTCPVEECRSSSVATQLRTFSCLDCGAMFDVDGTVYDDHADFDRRHR